MTIQEIADRSGVSTRTVQRRVSEFNEKTGSDISRSKNDQISSTSLIKFLLGAGLNVVQEATVADDNSASLMTPHIRQATKNSFKELKPRPAKVNGSTGKGAVASSQGRSKKKIVLDVLPVLPLPMLGLAASYGVYYFAVQFVPSFVAVGEAAAFELTYIGLAALKNLSSQRRKLARRVALGAVWVSVIYNSLAGAIELEPELLVDLDPFLFWSVCIVHGAPLAILAFYVSDLLFHSKDQD